MKLLLNKNQRAFFFREDEKNNNKFVFECFKTESNNLLISIQCSFFI